MYKKLIVNDSMKYLLPLQITATSYLNIEFKDLETLGVKYLSDQKHSIG